jgi:hypothetical protein
MTRLLVLAAICLSLLISEGCGSGGGAPGVNASAIVVGDPDGAVSTAKLVYRTRMKMPDAFFASLSTADRNALTALGVQISGGTLVFPDRPVAGEWVELSGKRYMTAQDGSLVVGTSALAGTASVYRQLTDARATGTFPAAGAFVASGAPPVTVIQRTLSPVGPMNNEEDPDTRSRAAECCTDASGAKVADAKARATRVGCTERDTAACAGNAAPCCLDYDNPLGNHKAYFRSIGEKEGGVLPIPTLCGLAAMYNFLNSTCYNWSFGLGGLEVACDNEKAFHPGDDRSPSCYQNHRYRNCQHLETEGFSVDSQDGTTVRPGETVRIRIYNNTKANESGVVIRPDESNAKGKLSGDGLDNEVLRHYDDGQRRHYEERILTYTAPQLPAGKATVLNTIRVRANGQMKEVQLTVTKQITWKGVFHFESIEGHHGVAWPDRPGSKIAIDMDVTLRGEIASTGQGGAGVSAGKFSWTASGFVDYGDGYTLTLAGSGSQPFAPPDTNFGAILDTKKGTVNYSFIVHKSGAWSLVSNNNGNVNTTPQILYATSSEFGSPITGTLGPDLTLKSGNVTRTYHASNGDYTVKLSWPDILAQR